MWTCVDLDECALGTDNCHDTFETCQNEASTGWTCLDVDECAAATHDCDPVLEHCQNALGSGWTCPSNAVVFATSGKWTPALGGLSGADAKCQAAAETAGLPGTFKAWLSDSTTDAAARLTHHAFRYILPDGTPLAENWEDLIDGNLAAKLYMDENKATGWFCNCSEDEVLTGTRFDGTKRAASDNYCGDYTVTNASPGPAYGRVSAYSDEGWSDHGNARCNWPLRLACVQQ